MYKHTTVQVASYVSTHIHYLHTFFYIYYNSISVWHTLAVCEISCTFVLNLVYMSADQHTVLSLSTSTTLVRIPTHSCTQMWIVMFHTNIMHLSTYNGNCVILIFHTATKEAMCNAQYLIANQTQQRDELSGSCNVSDDCTATECSLGIAFGQVLTYLTASITYYPCSTPYSFNAYTSVPAIGLSVNETITHSRCILIGGQNKLCFIVTQEPYRLIYSVSSVYLRI